MCLLYTFRIEGILSFFLFLVLESTKSTHTTTTTTTEEMIIKCTLHSIVPFLKSTLH